MRRHRLAWLLAASAALRAALVLRGGQAFWPDEWRYQRCWDLGALLLQGRLRLAFALVASAPDHPLFTVAGAPAALFQRIVMAASGLPFPAALWAGALALSFYSTACVALVFELAGQAGAGEDEAWLAAALMAVSVSMAYFSRHLLPYDAALAAALAGLCLLWRRQAGPGTIAAGGFALGASFLVYSGGWAFCAAGLAVWAWRRGATRGALAAASCAAPTLLLAAGARCVGLPSVFAGLNAYSRLQTSQLQGDMSEGWRLPWEYLWRSEHLLLLFLAGAAGTALIGRRRPERGRRWAAAALALYALLALPSTGLGRLGVYGRTSRALVPFLCLAAACGAARWLESAGARRRAAALGVLLLQAAVNFARPLSQRWPRDILEHNAGRVVCDFSATGPTKSPTATGCPLPEALGGRPDGRLVLLNVGHLYPVFGAKAPPAGAVLLRAEHPFSFEPYLFEGFTPAMRAAVRASDVSMRLIDTGRPAPPLR